MTLYVLAGLPGSGKSTLASRLAARVRGCHLRVDSIEQALRDGGVSDIGPLGYLAAQAVAADNLRHGLDVVADSVNPLALTRDAWRDVALRAGAELREVEIVCSSRDEHQRRVETRTSDVPGLRLPTWAEVTSRRYEAWAREHLVVDTAGQTPDASAQQLFDALGIGGR